MQIRRLTLDELDQAEGVAIVIDVIRAFTTAPVAFERGVEKILFVSSSDEAFRLKQSDPSLLIMGEEDGLPPDGYDFGNSPWEISNADLRGRTMVHRTSSGTQGVVGSRHCDDIYVSSFAIAGATVSAIRRSSPDIVSIINTGWRPNGLGDEDTACGDYLEALLKGESPDPMPYLARVDQCQVSPVFKDRDRSEYPHQDLDLCMDLDRYDFAIRVLRDGSRLIGVKSA